MKVAAQPKRQWANKVESPFLRGPARLLDAMAIIPQIRHALPEARLPFQRPVVLGAMFGSAVVVRALRGSRSVGPAAQELVSGLLSIAPAALALRGADVAAYHGAEHISIGSYEQGKLAAKEHNRCGSHLIGPLLVTTAIGNILAARAPAHLRRPARLGAQLSRWPLRPRSSAGWCATREQACARVCEARPRAPASNRDRGAVSGADRGRRGCARCVPRARTKGIVVALQERTHERLPPEVFDLPVEKMREGYYADAYFNHARSTLLAGWSPSARRDAGVPEAGCASRRHGRVDRDPQALLVRVGRAHGARALRR